MTLLNKRKLKQIESQHTDNVEYRKPRAFVDVIINPKPINLKAARNHCSCNHADLLSGLLFNQIRSCQQQILLI